MTVLTDALRALVDQQRFGYVATVDAQGRPNLSPKGTFLALEGDALAFAEMRSPNTLANIAANPAVEVNMVDVFARRGARFRGAARFAPRPSALFEELYPRWEAAWGPALGGLFNGFVVIELESAAMLSSPAYDIGAGETALRRDWLDKHTAQQRALIEEAERHG